MTAAVGTSAANAGDARLRRLVAAAVAVPPIVGAVLVALFAAFDLVGRAPLTYEGPLNIAEAAGMGSGSEVLRRLRQGEDPTAVVAIRPHIISSSITRVTAVEAAVWGRRVEVLRLLARTGAVAGERGRQYVACLATIARVPRIVEEFAPAGVQGCDADAVRRDLRGRAQ